MKTTFMRKSLTGFTFAVLAVTGLAACAGGGDAADNTPEPQGPIVLEFWHSAGGAAGETLNKLVDKFNAEHKGKIEIKASYQGKYEEGISKFISSVQTGKLPALLQTNDVQSIYMKDSGLVAPAQDLAARTGGYDFKKIVPAITNYYTLEGKVYSMPAFISLPQLYINNDLLKQAGVTADQLKTTKGLLAAVKQIHEKTGKAGLTFHQNGWFLEQLTASQGKFWCTPENGVGSKPADAYNLKDPEVTALWQEIGDLYQSKAILNVGTDQAAAMSNFLKGEVAIQMQSSGDMGNFMKGNAPFDWTTVPLPRDNAESGSVPGGNSIYAIKEGHNKWEQNAAWEFMKFIGSEDTQKEIFKTTGYLPTITSTHSQLGELKKPQESALKGLQSDPVSKITAGCHSGALNEARNYYQAAITGIANGGKASDEFAKADAKIKEAIANYNKRVSHK